MAKPSASSNPTSKRPPSTGRPPSLTPPHALSRGNACLPCRKRKMRCDGVRPTCGQCVGRRRPDDCEYTGQGMTKTQLLEENIALLESRIRELENQDNSAPSMKLHAPPVGSQNNVYLASNARSSVENSTAPATAEASDSITLQYVSAPEQDDPQEEISDLVDAFLPHATELGFFLHVARFILAFRFHEHSTSGAFLALLSAVSLWGSRLSPHPDLRSQEDRLLAESTGRLIVLFTDPSVRDHSVIYIIQAEVLLSNYFFYNGRDLEGRYHASAAGALALSCGLNYIRSDRSSADPVTPGQLPGLGNFQGLKEPEDDVQEGERIAAFWTVYILDKTWTISLEFPTAIPGESTSNSVKIDTPWPLDIESYDEENCHSGVRGHDTVNKFLLSGVGSGRSDGEMSTLALFAQASVLFARAAWISSQFRSNAAQDSLYAEVLAFHDIVTSFSDTLVPTLSNRAHNDSNYAVIRILAHVALLRLHRTFKHSEQRSREASVAGADAAMFIVRDLNIGSVQMVNPIAAVLLSAIAQAYIDEIVISKSLAVVPATQRTTNLYIGYSDLYIDTLVTSVQEIIAVLSIQGRTLPLMAIKAAEVLQELAVVL